MDELHSRGLDESAAGQDTAASFAIVSAGLFLLGGLALLSRPTADKPAKRRRSFGLLAILVSVAVYLLRPKPESAVWTHLEMPAQSEAPDAERSIPEEPEPEPDELLPAAQVDEGAELEEDAEPESNGWHVIAEAREQRRARVDSSRPFVLIQSDESEQTEVVHAEVHAQVHAEVEQREPVEGVVNRVGLYSRRPDDMLEPAEAESF